MEYEIRPWFTNDPFWTETGESLISAGLWELRWEDGLTCELIRALGGKRGWVAGDLTDENDELYKPVTPLPDAATKTRRELVQILCGWRERELRAQRENSQA